MMRSHRLCAATTARKLHASHTPREHQQWCSHGVHEACDLRRRVWMLFGCCFGAAWVLLGCCLGAAL
eukprot:5062828-Lingulodinium_polyedra.AAC.1